MPAALAEAAWREADAALAEALCYCDEAMTAKAAPARTDALAMLEQALSRAGRKRGMSRTGALGAIEPFDKAEHDLVGGATAARVRVVARGVMRGGDVLAKPRAAPARTKRR
ncbi:MAG: hypothetical protein AB7P07_08460 [Hyphomonadaceae bacterium]